MAVLGNAKWRKVLHVKGVVLNNRDICSDIQSPTIAISLTPTDAYNYLYDFHFSETVIAISDNAHKSFINLSISGKFEEYLYDYEVELLKNSNNIEARILDDIPKSKGLVEFYMGMQVNLIPMSSLMDDDVIYIYIYIDSDNIFQA